ncbi:glycosyltransferase [Clostridium chromiireducens]|uniref:Putative glycosyltransferase EpsE n=1 Tax=Clostridium chromiireducens TaxID=225345 RepID=A0A1V4IHV2_9CLOT|nr:glycosyltransferase [Clostridium chromiireducens]OPJ59533.1 putative glycosyltransferase EpsE [Clostridium chromiireducens]
MGKCSVLLPVYNGEKYIIKTINSILNQTYKDIEILIADDKSTDGTLSIVKELEKKFLDKIRVYENESNKGVGNNLYNLTKKVNGKYIAMIGQDDIWENDYLRRQIEALEKERAIVAFGKVNYIDSEDIDIPDYVLFDHKQISSLNRRNLFFRLFKGNMLCAPSSVINLNEVNKDEVIKFWGYNNDKLQDYELWLFLSLKGDFIYNKQACCNYRIHNQNFSSAQTRIIQARHEFYATLRRVVFSNTFMKTIEESNDKEMYITEFLGSLIYNMEFCRLLRILVIDYCEYMLNEGYEYNILKSTLAKYYNEIGMLNKVIALEGKLDKKISVVVCGNVDKFREEELKREPDNFEISTNIEDINEETICITQSDSLEYMLNNKAFFNNATKNKVVILCKEEEESRLMQAYSNLLVVSRGNPKNLRQLLINFVEDKTDMYYSGYFNIRYKYDPFRIKNKSNIFLIENNDKIVRRVKFLTNINVKNISISTSNKIIDNIWAVTNNEWHIEDNNNTGDFYIRTKEELDIGMKIVINNEIYVLNSLIMNENNEIIPKYSIFSYYMSNPENESIYSVNNEYFTEINDYYRIVNSRSYKYQQKINNFIDRHNLRKLMKWIDRKLTKLYRRLKK